MLRNRHQQEGVKVDQEKLNYPRADPESMVNTVVELGARCHPRLAGVEAEKSEDGEEDDPR